LVCSESPASVLFRPCGHMVACKGCASIMKKCVDCRMPIEQSFSLAVCSGAKVGNVAKAKKGKKTNNPLVAKSNAAAEAAQQATSSTASSNTRGHSVGGNLLMNNGNRDTTNTDVQKLQEQLNDIKEQVMLVIHVRFIIVIFIPSNRIFRSILANA